MTNSKRILIPLALLILCCLNLPAQVKKVDTTLKMNNAGFRISCNNKTADDNTVSIDPVGFKNSANSISFRIKGRLISEDIGDLNNDGYPDLLLYVFGIPNVETGTAICVTSVENKSLAPIPFPDIYDNPKLREGYKGHDEFSLKYGFLNRSFPVYKTGDADDKPTGGKRMVQYQVVTENGRPAFKVLRTYDAAQ